MLVLNKKTLVQKGIDDEKQKNIFSGLDVVGGNLFY